MTPVPRTILVTGAAGFVGRATVAALLAQPALAQARIVATDRVDGDWDDPRVVAMVGDIADPALLAALLRKAPEAVVHLAGVLGGAAEADYALARRVNLDASMALIEGLRDLGTRPRLVFASSIAVFGPPLPALVDDDTPPRPVMTYGAQKRMVEVAIEQFSARGWIDGIALRLPGIVARPGADARLKSAFLHALFDAVAAGEPITLPVAADGTTWLLSVAACAEAFGHALILPADRLDERRAMTLPALNTRFDALVAALARRNGREATVTYAADPAIAAQFGTQPPLVTPIADALGFRHDGDVDVLVSRAVAAR